VFGFDEKDKVREVFMFQQNQLVFTSIDIQSVEPVDQRTRDSLQKSVQLAIEITTNSQEAAARYDNTDDLMILAEFCKSFPNYV
jgi:major vault protein